MAEVYEFHSSLGVVVVLHSRAMASVVVAAQHSTAGGSGLWAVGHRLWR